MNWFCKQIPIDYCKECGLAYKKESYGDLTEYCSIHREPRLVLMRRKQLVMAWADVNWETIEAQAIEADKLNRERLNSYFINSAAHNYQQQSMAAQRNAKQYFMWL